MPSTQGSNTEGEGSFTTEGEGVEGESTEGKGALTRESEGVFDTEALRSAYNKEGEGGLIEYGG